VLVRILGFGTYDMDRHPRIGVVLEGFRAHGDQVIEANEPLGVSTAERVDLLRRPWKLAGLVPTLLGAWWRIAHRARRQQGGWDAVVVGYLGHFDVVLARLLFPRDTVVLDLLIFGADTARDRGMQGSLRLRLLGLVTSSQRHKVVVVPVGAPAVWFDAGNEPGEPAELGAGEPDPLRVMFYGLFTPLQGARVIGEALGSLARRQDLEFTMVGSGQDYEAARAAAAANPQVTWIAWVDGHSLPVLVAGHEVSLGIFGDGPKALRVVPNKVYQGAAAGCAIVTSNTAPQVRTLGDAAVLVPPGDAVALAEALQRLADDRMLVASLRQRSGRLAEASFTGASVVEPLRSRLHGG
jgi:glycosyltransferase involved in cell wall biosynthesis